MSRAYELGAQGGLPLSAHYLQNLRTVYISRGFLKLPHSCLPGSSLRLRFWDLPRMISVYTSDLISDAFDQQRWDERSPDESQAEVGSVLYSAITDLSLACSNVSGSRVIQIVSTLKELVRFRWTNKFPSSLSNDDEQLDLESKIILKILVPYKGSLKELDLRFLGGTSHIPLPKSGAQSDAKEKPLFLSPTSIRKQTWSDEVLSFANTLPASMRFPTEVQLIASGPSLGWNSYIVERDELLEPAKRLFQEKGVVCSVTKVLPEDEFSDFRTISHDD
ncbi:hypothetical protein BGAL_0095g00030 [Botrytis galanthina]|uniref:Uncharacterized protein n=1 Tax=Botrytis galanthina TaxID=278940 RepID=A0A4S8R2A0_9HELO|nr:hypothetical protein BGAL_0095g00030 [Botrytis galanthina]